MSEAQPDLDAVLEDLANMQEALQDMYLYVHNLQKEVAGADPKPAQEAIKQLYAAFDVLIDQVEEVAEPGEECGREVLDQVIADTAQALIDFYEKTGAVPHAVTFEADIE